MCGCVLMRVEVATVSASTSVIVCCEASRGGFGSRLGTNNGV